MVVPNEILLKRTPPKRIATDPRQPRKRFKEKDLLALGLSMQQEGQKVPLRVYQIDDDHYGLISGERRLRAALLVGLPEVNVLVEPAPANEEELVIDQIIENILAKRLSPIERTGAILRLLELGLSNQQIADRLQTTACTISKDLTIENCLCEPLRALFNTGKLPVHEAYIIAKVPNHDTQEQLGTGFLSGKIKRAELEARARAAAGKGKSKKDNTLTLPLRSQRNAGYPGLLEAIQKIADKVRKWNSNKIPFAMIDQIWREDA